MRLQRQYYSLAGDKSSTPDAQTSDRQQNRRDGISEGDGIITSGKSSVTAKNDMNATETRCEAANKRNKHKVGKRKEDGKSGGRRSMATGREENHQNAGRIAGRASKKSRSNVARSSTISGGAKSAKDLGKTKKRNNGPSEGVLEKQAARL